MDFRYGKLVSKEFIIDKLQWDKNNWMKKISWKIAKNAKQKITTCPICNTKPSKKFFGWYGYSYLRCKKCELIYANRRLTEEKSSIILFMMIRILKLIMMQIIFIPIKNILRNEK